MPGKIVDILVEAGQRVEEEEVLLILEAMKMQNEIQAPFTGVVSEIHASVGDSVDMTDVVIRLSKE